MNAPRARAAMLAGAFLAALVAATFADAFTGARVFYQRDIQAYWYPQRAVLERAIAEGSWPLWNPWVGFGAPLLADASFQLAYPPTWPGPALGLAPAVQFKLLAIGHCLFAAAGAGALARRLGVGWTAAAAAGATYALSGPLLSALSLFHHYAGAAWMPWLLLALEGLLKRPGLATALGLGLVAAGQVLAGSGDMCLAGGILGAARIVWHLLRARPRGLVALGGSGLLAAGLALALGAVQWLPTAERAREGFRTAQDPRTNTYWSLHPATLVDLAVPRLVTDLPLSAAGRRDLFEGREPLLACVYMGLGPLALSALGLGLRGRLAVPAGAGFLFFVIAALGRHTPVYGVLLGVPGFGLMRYPQKFLIPASMCLALMAAAGAAAWDERWSLPQRRRGRFVALLLLATAAVLAVLGLATSTADAAARPLDLAAGSGAALATRAVALKFARSALLAGSLGLLLWRRSGSEPAVRAVTVALLGLGGLDLVLVGRTINPLAPAELLDHRPPVVALLEPGAPTRLHAAAETPACLAPGPAPKGWTPAWVAALGFQDTLRPPSGARWELRGSFDGEFTGLGSRWSAPMTREVWARLGTPDGLRLLQLGGVSHVLRVGRSSLPGLELLETRGSPYVCPLQVWRVGDPLAEVYVARRERSAADPEATLRVLLEPGFDPRSDVVLAEARNTAPVPSGADDVRVLSRRLDAVEVEAILASAGVLVVLEAFEPGWIATVDGAPAPVLRANGLFRAVRLEAGRHRVLFAYRPRSVAYGAAFAVCGVAAALGLGFLARAQAARLKGKAGEVSIRAGSGR